MTKAGHLRKYDVIMVYEDTTVDEIKNNSSKLPTDVHAVTYREDGKDKVDAVRSYKMSDIFDAYYDYGVRDFVSIKSGFGSIKPKLYQGQSNDNGDSIFKCFPGHDL